MLLLTLASKGSVKKSALASVNVLFTTYNKVDKLAGEVFTRIDNKSHFICLIVGISIAYYNSAVRRKSYFYPKVDNGEKLSWLVKNQPMACSCLYSA